MAEPTPTNGTKITLAVLNNNILHLTNDVAALRADVCAKQKDQETRLRVIEGWGATAQEKWRQHEEDHKGENVKNWAADIIGTIAAAVAGILVGKP